MLLIKLYNRYPEYNNLRKKVKKLLELIITDENIFPDIYELIFITFFWILNKFCNFSQNGIKVMSENWDYLIVLDACRYDYFKKYNYIDGILIREKSLGVGTPSWIKNNFIHKYKDVVYVSANPYISKLKLKQLVGFNPFYHIEPVWKYGWDHYLSTVPPENVTIASIKMMEKYPNKRIITHYLQPHPPFLVYYKNNFLKYTRFVDKYIDIDNKRNLAREYAKHGEVDTELIQKGYINNLMIVLKEANKLLEKMVGKIVITSDHGECFGEYALFGHPRVYIKPLYDIPWLVINKDN
ncbi:MAG: hypothetical protein ACFFDN_23130 [Candidatus Hodarchaeota archaeon]